MENCEVRNRYGNEYNFEPLTENTYRIVGDVSYWRFGGKQGESGINDNDLGFADPSGGPFISHGYQIEGRKVNRIFLRGEDVCFEVE